MPKWLVPAVIALIIAVAILFYLVLSGGGGGGGGGGGSSGLAQQIHEYLGTNKGDKDKELIANIEFNNEFLRKAITDLQCDIYMLQNPGPKPTPCPPGGGSTSPIKPPGYPP